MWLVALGLAAGLQLPPATAEKPLYPDAYGVAGVPVHVLNDVSRKTAGIVSSFEGWCSQQALPYISAERQGWDQAKTVAGQRVYNATQLVNGINAEFATLKRANLPQPGQTGLAAAMGALERSASPEQKALEARKVHAGIELASAKSELNDADFLSTQFGLLESKVAKASYQARNFDAEVQAYLNPPSNLAGLALAQNDAAEKKSAMQQKLEAKARMHKRLRSYSASVDAMGRREVHIDTLGRTLYGKCGPACQIQRAAEAFWRAIQEALRLARLAQERAHREAQAAAVALAEQRRREEQERAAREAARRAEEERLAEEERRRKEEERLEAERKAAEAARKAEEERIAAEKAAHEAAEARRILEEDFAMATKLADHKKATVLDALQKRRDGLLDQKKQCEYMKKGQADVAQKAVDAKVGVEAAAAQQAGRAQVADATKGTFEDMAAKLSELQASVDAIFLEEKKLYAEEAEATYSAEGKSEAAELADGGHALWMGWKKAFDEQFESMKSFVQLRHGQLVSYKENYEYLRADRMPVSEKTEAPDGLACDTPTEFQAKLDEIDSQIAKAGENNGDYGYPDPLPPIEKGLGIRTDLRRPEDHELHDEMIHEHPELEAAEELKPLMKQLATPVR
jgi:hypothetical protein